MNKLEERFDKLLLSNTWNHNLLDDIAKEAKKIAIEIAIWSTRWDNIVGNNELPNDLKYIDMTIYNNLFNKFIEEKYDRL